MLDRAAPFGRTLCLMLGLFVATTGAWAQTNGKVTGVVLDARTREPLPGVSVYLDENRYVGTTTDIEGRYFLLSVPPGSYTLVMSFVGYATLRQQNVEVYSGRTTTADGNLREEVIEGEEIVVSAERPIVIRDRTTTVSFVGQEAIERLPVQEVSDLIKFQPGVVRGNDGFHFRGGRARETAYIIDGIPVQDVLNQGGGNTVDIEVQSVQELQVFTGTFDAEFGGAQSGIVNVTTRDPGQKWQGNLRAQAGGFYAGNDDVFAGLNSYSPAESKDLTLTLNGPLIPGSNALGLFVSGRYEDRVGYLKGERRFTPEDGSRIDTYRRWYRDVYQPGDTRLIALDTARTPAGGLILDKNGNPITFSNGDGALVNMDWGKTLTVNPKLVWRPTGSSRLTFTGLFNQREGQGYDHDRRFAPDFRPTYYARDLTGIVNYQQAIGLNKVLTLRASYKYGHDESYAFESIDDPRMRYLEPEDEVTGYRLGATNNNAAESSERQFISSGDFLWQINERNELKSGFQLRWNRFVDEDLDRSWVYPFNPDSLFLNFFYPNAADFGNFDDYYAAVISQEPIRVPELARYAVDDRFDNTPVEWSAFVQDKLEFDTRLVVKAGLRFEYFDVNVRSLVDPRTPTDRIGRDDNFRDTPAKYYFSPRIGISYPISATGAFRVAYGHFVQMPAYREMFKNPVFADINVGRLEGRAVGNPDLQPERTIKYEMGLQQQLSDFIGVDVNLFYKNIRNLLGTEILGTLDNVLYTRTVNRDYGLVRGATLSLVTRPIGMFLGSTFDVTYSDARGSSSNPSDVANIVIAGRSGEIGDLYMERQIIPLTWDQTFTMNASANVGNPGDWSVGFIGQFATGQPYTPTFLDPTKDFPDNEFDNAERKPSQLSLDVNAEKRFNVGRIEYGIRLQVNNVLNRLNELSVNSISGRAGQVVRLPVEQADRERVLEYVRLFNNREADVNPAWYSAPRQILVAFSVNF